MYPKGLVRALGGRFVLQHRSTECITFNTAYGKACIDSYKKHEIETRQRCIGSIIGAFQ